MQLWRLVSWENMSILSMIDIYQWLTSTNDVQVVCHGQSFLVVDVSVDIVVDVSSSWLSWAGLQGRGLDYRRSSHPSSSSFEQLSREREQREEWLWKNAKGGLVVGCCYDANAFESACCWVSFRIARHAFQISGFCWTCTTIFLSRSATSL